MVVFSFAFSSLYIQIHSPDNTLISLRAKEKGKLSINYSLSMSATIDSSFTLT